MLDSEYPYSVRISPVRRRPNPKQRTLDLEPRTVRLELRLTEDEKISLERVAKSRHTTLSEAFRQLLHAEAEKLEKEKREAA